MVTIWNTRWPVSSEHVLNKHLPEGRMKSTVSSTAGPQKGEGRGVLVQSMVAQVRGSAATHGSPLACTAASCGRSAPTRREDSQWIE